MRGKTSVSDAAANTVIGSRRRPIALGSASAASAKSAGERASSLDHDRGRLDDRGRRRPGLEAELLRRLARDHRDDPERAGLELDLGEQALDLHLADDARRAGSAPTARGDRPPRSRSISLAETTRRLACRAACGSVPARSQRRSVSRLIPSRRAASPAVYVCLGIA